MTVSPSHAMGVLLVEDDDGDALIVEDLLDEGAHAQDYLVKGRVDGGLLARAIRYAVGRRHAEEVQQQLRVAEVRADENARLERGLVPHPIVNDSALWIASSYLPGRRRALLGGDFYDAVGTPDGSVHVIVGDVSGHGPDEAALGAGLRIAWRALTLSGATGDVVLRTLERVIEHERQVPGAFATVCTMEIRPSDPSLCLRRAGHPPPVLIDGGSITSLPIDPGGPPIGMFSGSDWPESRFELPADWSILLYTDGIIEGGVNGGPDRLGEEGLRALIADYVQRHPSWRSHPQSLLGRLITRTKELNGEELSDDVAMLFLGLRDVSRDGG